MFTDRRPEGEVSKHVTPYGSPVVTSLSQDYTPQKARFNLHCYNILLHWRMAKRPPLSKGKEKGKCFDFSYDDDDFETYTRGFVPTTTATDTQKCVKLFNDWKKEWNLCFPSDSVPEEILLDDDKTKVCKWLCKFGLQVRKKMVCTTLPERCSTTYWRFKGTYAYRSSQTSTLWTTLSFFHWGNWLIPYTESYTRQA